MIAMEDGKLIGSDAEIIATIAKKLGLGVKSAQMEWSATVQSVKSGRADIMAGNMGWTPARAQALLITDAIYYAGTFACMKKDQPFTRQHLVGRHEGPLDRHRQRLHHRAGDEEDTGRRRGQALRQQRRLRARRGGGAARFRGAGCAAGGLHDPEEPELEPEAGADRARSGIPAADQQAAHRHGHEPGEPRPVRRRQCRREMDVEDRSRTRS